MEEKRYIITKEKVTREAYSVSAQNLSTAKNIATTCQFCCGTITTLIISDEHGNTLAYRKNGKWHDNQTQKISDA